MLIWIRVDTHGMKSGEYRIGKFPNPTRYVLHHEYQRLGIYDSFEQAKEAAQQEHAEGRRE